VTVTAGVAPLIVEDVLEPDPVRLIARRPSRGVRLVTRFGPPVLGVAWVLGVGLPRLGRQPFWIDESFTVGATHDLVGTWEGTGGTMGLYYLLMWPVTEVSLDRAWLRLPSLLCTAATVLVVHAIGRRIGGPRMGAMAAGFLAASWAIARYGIEARSYALAMLLVSLSWLGLVGAVARTSADGAAAGRHFRWRQRSRAGRWWWRLFVVATLLAPLAHGLAALHFVSQVLVLGLAPRRWRWWRACIPVAVALAIEGALLFSLGAGEVADWIPPLNDQQIMAILRYLIGEDGRLQVLGALAILAVVVGVVDALVSWWRRARARRRARAVLRGVTPDVAPSVLPGVEGSDDGRPLVDGAVDAWLRLVPIFYTVGMPLLLVGISVFRPYGAGRYAVGSVPGVALLLAGLLARLRPRALAIAAWVAIALVLATDQPTITRQGSEDWAGLVDRITTEGHDGDQLMTRSMLRAPIDYAWVDGVGIEGRPSLVPLTPTEPLGEVRRFYDDASGPMREHLQDEPTSKNAIWYVARHVDVGDYISDLLSHPTAERNYELTGVWSFRGHLYLVRFEPRPVFERVGMVFGGHPR
jgi:hypothetical protein